MNKRVALCLALLKGDIINVSNSIKICGYSNPAREIAREVEIPFGIIVSRVRQTNKDQFGNPVTYIDYRLNKSLIENKEGIQKLRDWLKEELSKEPEPKTDAQTKIYKQQELFINTL